MIDDDHGIRAFIRSSKEILTGRIKKYFEDFHVYEIQNNEEICHLTEIKNKSDILAELEVKRRISSGEDLFSHSGFEIKKEFIEKLILLEIPSNCIDNIIFYVKFLGEIKRLTINSNINNKLFKFDSKGKLFTVCELKIRIPNRELNSQLSNKTNERESNTKICIVKTSKMRRKLFHEAIKEYIPFITSQTIDTNFGEKKTESNVKHFENIDLFLSNELFAELSKNINFSEFITEERNKEYVENGGQEIVDYIVLRPSRDFIYSLRNLTSTSSLDINDDENYNNSYSSKKIKYNNNNNNSTIASYTNYELGKDERWNPNIPCYIHFTVYKENRDTIDAINMISKCLRRNHKSFGIAGLKDRRGITTQRVSAYKVLEEQLIYATTLRGWDRNIRICDFKYENNHINIGDLKGNLFHVVIRDLKITVNEKNANRTGNITIDTVKNLIEEIKTLGFINYFGLQRFGTSCIPTYKIGISILKENWKKAFLLIIGFDDDKLENFQASDRELFHEITNGKFDNYLRRLSPHSYIEKLIINGIIRELKNEKIYPESLLNHKKEKYIYKNSLNYLPKNSYSLYLHSVQSLIFNLVASERIKRFGNTPIVGDLVLQNQDEDLKLHDMKDFGALNKQPKVIILKESEINDYTIQDVVLTLPGDDVIYPPNMNLLYKEIVNELLGIDLNFTAFGMKGSYRNLVVVPKEISYTTFNLPEENKGVTKESFSDPKLILSDLDALLAPESRELTNTKTNEVRINEKLLGFKNEDSKCSDIVNTVVFSCKLPKSSYVTVALRELLGSFPIE
ncbi:hypothetical protein RS030_111698 [Cryptosporidium xiaoi]|uniref:TRUD domain-containing protein n=1 Tax=Cryptosporidium xiaoi TaxID=659607 RepID=A0AAV9YBE4_9CRYT